MPIFSQKFLWFWFLVFALVFSAQVVSLIYQESPTNDEPVELTNGYFYWQGDVVTHDHHPPLPKMLQALPLRFMGLNNAVPPQITDIQSKAYYFFFILNKDRVEAMVQAGRWVTLAFGLGIGLLLFYAVREKSFIVAFSCFFLWAFHPTFLAYSGIALADLPAAFFFFLAVLAFEAHLKGPGPRGAFIAGLLGGVAVCSKFSALALVPTFAALEALNFCSARPAWQSLIRDWAAGIIGFFAAIGFLYLPGSLLLSEHLLPWSYFLAGLRHMAAYSAVHHPTYFCGLASRENHWLYFPATFLLKDTLPFLILLFLGLELALLRRRPLPFWLWFSPVFFFACILPVQNLGIRYLLPAFPFFILIAAETLGWLWESRWEYLPNLNGKWVVVGLLAWHAGTTLWNAPDMIGYFNDWVPEQKKAYYLADNDLDIGQDVKRLAEVARQRGWKHIKLAQFGGAVNLSFYGIPVEPWSEKDIEAPQPGTVYVANVTFFQIGPLFFPDLIRIARCWAARAQPTGRVGDAWIYFEEPGETQPDKSARFQSIRSF